MAKVRPIIQIDEELCTGCGQCVLDCAEGALQIIDGKARLVGEIFCDGLGACLAGCPTGALQVIERPAEEFNEKAVEQRLHALKQQAAAPEAPLACGCPGSAAMALQPAAAPAAGACASASQLGHWPIKLQLLAPAAPFLQGADMVLLADCAGVALPDLHARLLPKRAVALACPKLDNAQAHIDKLAQVLAQARPRSLTVAIMEVPCCRGLEFIAQKAMEKAGLDIPLGRLKVGRQGEVLEDVPPAQRSAA